MKQISFFTIALLIIICFFFSSCGRSKPISKEERNALAYTRDSLDAISRDTILVNFGNNSKKIKMAWSRNTTALQKEFIEDFLKGLVFVEGGTFKMGCTQNSDTLCDESEGPVHLVTLSSFYISKFEVTQLLWLELMGYNPNAHKNNMYPVSNVSWDEVQEFVAKINHLTSLHFTIPTEAQWEFAARGGNKSNNTIYAGSNKIEKVAWYKENAISRYHPVGTLSPNELGIFDMSGNVWEWCSDFYAPYPAENSVNPKGPATGINKVYRGGSWLDNANYTRITKRNCGRANYKMNCIGFRLVLIP